MATTANYRDQANVFFRMALLCSDCEQSAQLEAQGRMFLSMARQSARSDGSERADEGFNIQQSPKT
jgi:hypothetical protein